MSPVTLVSTRSVYSTASAQLKPNSSDQMFWFSPSSSFSSAETVFMFLKVRAARGAKRRMLQLLRFCERVATKTTSVMVTFYIWSLRQKKRFQYYCVISPWRQTKKLPVLEVVAANSKALSDDVMRSSILSIGGGFHAVCSLF